MEHSYNGVVLSSDQIENHRIRHATVLKILKDARVHEVVDIGCSEGRFLEVLLRDGNFQKIIGVDPDAESLARARELLAPLDTGSKIQLKHQSVFDYTGALEIGSAVTLIEVIEHFLVDDVPRLEQKIFGELRPNLVVVTTPLAEPRKTPEQMAALGHHSEWDGAEFRAWYERVGKEYGYGSTFTLLQGGTFKRGCQVVVFKKIS